MDDPVLAVADEFAESKYASSFARHAAVMEEIARVRAQRDELLEALQALLFEAEQFARVLPPYKNSGAIANARAAIERATGNEKT